MSDKITLELADGQIFELFFCNVSLYIRKHVQEPTNDWFGTRYHILYDSFEKDSCWEELPPEVKDYAKRAYEYIIFR
jgi:hypothetical protein